MLTPIVRRLRDYIAVRWAVAASRKSPPPIPVAARVSRFSYAIRNIVVEAQRVEAAGRRVRYLNIGDPVAFGFKTPPHLIEAVERAMRDGHNGYGPSAGIASAREAVAAEYTSRGFPVSPDRVFITAGTSEGIELALTALVDESGEVLVPMPTYPLYTAVLAKLGAHARCSTAPIPARGWMPDLEHLRSLVTPATRALVVIDPEQPDRRDLLHRGRGVRCSSSPSEHGLAILADEVYGDLGFDGPVRADRQPRSGRADHLVLEPVEGVSRAGLAHRAGWRSAGRRGWTTWWRRSASWPTAGCAAPCRCSTRSTAALTGDRSHQVVVPRRAQGARRDHDRAPERDPGRHLRRADGGLLRDAARGAAARQDRRGLRARRCCARPACCASTARASARRPEDGFLRIVFLASPGELRDDLRPDRRLHAGLPPDETASWRPSIRDLA